KRDHIAAAQYLTHRVRLLWPQRSRRGIVRHQLGSAHPPVAGGEHYGEFAAQHLTRGEARRLRFANVTTALDFRAQGGDIDRLPASAFERDGEQLEIVHDCAALEKMLVSPC